VVRLICGLGNPGLRYQHTRHNLGLDIVDRLAEKLTAAAVEEAMWFDYRRFSSTTAEAFLIRPATFVNRSGLAAEEALRLFEAQPSQLLVISDDFHLPLGSLRIRKSGSSGGHNGLESIIETLAEKAFPRMRVGIGPLPPWAAADPEKTPDFVLSRFEASEREIVENTISLAVEALRVILSEGLDMAISRYNKINPTPES